MQKKTNQYIHALCDKKNMRHTHQLVDKCKNMYSDTVFDLFSLEPIRRQGCGLKSLLDSVQTDIQHADLF